MRIDIPKRYYRYVNMLVEAKFFRSEEEAVTALFETGLYDAEHDAVNGAGEPDIRYESMIRKRKMEFEIPGKTEYIESLEIITKAFALRPKDAATISFALGLGIEGYFLLKDSESTVMTTIFVKKWTKCPMTFSMKLLI